MPDALDTNYRKPRGTRRSWRGWLGRVLEEVFLNGLFALSIYATILGFIDAGRWLLSLI